MALRLSRVSRSLRVLSQVRTMSDDKGTGSGYSGAIRDAGGAWGKREAALEDQYFRRLQDEQLKALKESINDEIHHHKDQIKEHEQDEQLKALKDHHAQELHHHQDQIKQHQEAIQRHNQKIKKLDTMTKEGHDSD